MTSGQWLYIFGMEAVRIEKDKEKTSSKPRGTTYQIVKEP